jgi:hypothetical protein
VWEVQQVQQVQGGKVSDGGGLLDGASGRSKPSVLDAEDYAVHGHTELRDVVPSPS